MARRMADGTVKLNEIQTLTYRELVAAANKQGLIPASVVAGYKANVIRGITKWGALSTQTNGALRIPRNVNVVQAEATEIAEAA